MVDNMPLNRKDASGVKPELNDIEGKPITIRTVSKSQSCMGYSLILQLQVEGVMVVAVIDCGAQVTVIRRSWVKRQRWLDNLALSNSFQLKGASEHGSSMSAMRADKVNIDLDGVTVCIPVYVADISDDCILGLDWIRANKVTIDFEHGVIFTHSRTIVAQYKQWRAGLVPLLEARTVKKTLLQPNEMRRIDVAAPLLHSGWWLLQDC